MKLALIQMESKVGDVDNNISTATRLIDEAAAAGANIILLPEYWSTGFFPASRDYKMYDLAAPDNGVAMTAIKEKSLDHHIHIVATIFERDGSDLYYDTSILVGPDGKIIGKYRKTHIGGERHVVIDGELVTDLGIESIYFRTGSRYPVFEINGWKVGIILCYDTYFPESTRCLALAGAEVILAPFGISDTKKTIWKELLATRAFENMAYIAAANNIGYVPTPDIKMVMGGRSIAFDPLGELITEASYDQEEILYVDLDHDHILYARRLHMMFRDRRPETYGVISTPTDEIDR
jgi:N-carbamoylputrescine amidase